MSSRFYEQLLRQYSFAKNFKAKLNFKKAAKGTFGMKNSRVKCR